MKGKINEKGYLEIKRTTRYMVQWCPFSNGQSMCGDWCPLFGEPVYEKDGRVLLTICQNSWFDFKKDDFTDERGE